MSWQRIDENTYIDDTLVTCAEYQLFIDEMREQGKYYQPDHWTSYQFPAGQALEPIIGVRYLDAIVFSMWLAGRGYGEWEFRLPSQMEADTFAITSLGKGPIGYWLDERYQFEWVGSVPENPRTIYNLSDALTKALIRNRIIPFDPDRDLDIAHALNIDGARHALKLVRALDLDRTIITISRHNLDSICELSLSVARNLDHTIVPDMTLAVARALDIYIDIFTLQERIAGRSPAFEGIRLVKERIR